MASLSVSLFGLGNLHLVPISFFLVEVLEMLFGVVQLARAVFLVLLVIIIKSEIIEPITAVGVEFFVFLSGSAAETRKVVKLGHCGTSRC